MKILPLFTVWIIVSAVFGYYTSWWLGLLLVMAFPLLAYQWFTFVWNKAKILSVLDKEYDYDLRNLPYDSPQASTLNSLLRGFRQTKYEEDGQPLNEYDMATMFMAIMVNSPSGEKQGRSLEEKQQFAKKIRDNARRLDSAGRISANSAIESIEIATTEKFGIP